MCHLLVAGVTSEENDADSPTRGCKEHPDFSAARLRLSYEAAIRALQGCERQRLNSNSMKASHFQASHVDDSDIDFSYEMIDSDESSDGGDEMYHAMSECISVLVDETTLDKNEGSTLE
jgi:hypothetical protein